MPNRDGTGPEGKGAKTGRQMGNCKGAKQNKNTPKLEDGKRPRKIFGRGRGFRRNFQETEE